jgi:hypothetical protein
MKKIIYSLTLLFLIQIASFGQTTYIRTVVHVLYTGSVNDVTDETVSNYIAEVNKGLAKQLTPTFFRSTPIFDTLWANTEIQICLATLDPNVITTNGITHTIISNPMQTSNTPIAPIWDATTYFNIYLTPVYPEPGFPSFILGGWASTPTNPQPGSIYNYALVATNSISFIPQFLSHEIGHVFGLDHVSQDLINDTPDGMESILPSTGYSTTCSPDLQNANTSTLTQDGMHWGGVDPPNMVENFMGLSFCCSYMFTKGQKSEMQSYIHTYLPNWITTNCEMSSLSDKPSDLNNISIFPNPATDVIRFGGATIISVSILDMAGKQIMMVEQVINNEILVDKLANGIYQVVISTEMGIQSQKIIIF